MLDLDALFRQVLQHRRDDMPRIAYANALGTDPRGEFIKVQIALAGGRERVGKQYYDSRRGRELLQAHGAEWAAGVKPFVENYTFRRGFVERIVTSARRFVDNAETLLKRAPLLDLVLRDSAKAARELFACPQLEGLRSLNLADSTLGDEDAIRLAQSPYLSDLRWLNLSGNRIGRAGMEAIAASNRLPALKWIDLSYNAAPDPTPQPAEEYGMVHGEQITDFGKELRRRFPDLEWLKGPGLVDPDYKMY